MVVLPERWSRLRERLEPYAAVGAFFGGFLWDALTLVRIDRLTDDLLLLAYLIALGVLLIVERRIEDAPDAWPRLAPHHAWVVYLAQFFFGGLFSAQLVFYARAATWGPQLLFVVVLASLLVANEFLHHAFRRTWLRLSLYWLVTFTFLLFFVPVVTGYPGSGLFVVAAVLATAIALLVVAGMFLPLDRSATRRVLGRHAALFTGLACVMGALELQGLIPPVPLALLEVGIFHGIERRHEPSTDPDEVRRSTRYWLKYEDPAWYQPFRDDDADFRWREGEKAYCFSAIFAPTGMTGLKVFHVWERWEEPTGWTQADRIDVTSRGAITGGAAQGFRTWSEKARLADGDWRCRVVDASDRELGRVRFHVTKTTAPAEFVERPWD